MAEGQRLLLGIALYGQSFRTDDGITEADVEATHASLRYTELEWYGDMPADRRKELFKTLVHDSEPAT